MRIFEPIEELEKKEEELNSQIHSLSEKKKKRFFSEQSKLLKDPDTYAVLNFFFIGGFHHCYLKKYSLFLIELSSLIIATLAIISGFTIAIFILVAMIFFELPQLFCAQKIARQYNYDLSYQLFNEIKNSSS